MPLHPWQWQQKLPSISPSCARGEMVELGEFGDEYLVQQSLRTLTNASRRAPYDIKLPLTIYNTSCYRGIPSTLPPGRWLLRWLQQQFASDATSPALAQVLGRTCRRISGAYRLRCITESALSLSGDAA